MSDQILIGVSHTGAAGLPISAPVNPEEMRTTLRWRKTENSFVLEQLVKPLGFPPRWVEVPCVD